MKSRFSIIVGVVGLSIWAAGCAKKTVAVATPSTPPPVTQAKPEPTAPAVAAREPSTPRQPVTTANARPASPDAATRSRIQDLLNRIQDAYFDYNDKNIRPDAEAALRADAQALSEILRDYPNYKLTVEGYADERGSDQYNLALGDARAERAKTFLSASGVPANQIRVVSYGKEHPVCTEKTEECWQRNRRAHITQNQ